MNLASSDSDDADTLLGLLREYAVQLAAELSWVNEVHENADKEGQLLAEIVALQAARETLDFLLILAGKHDDVGVKRPLKNVEHRLLRSTRRGAPGLSPRERHVRWWVVAAVQVLVATKVMGLNDARKYVCKSLKKRGFKKKRKAQGQREHITPDTIKGWERQQK